MDFHGAFSAVILGHSFPAVVQQVAERIKDLVLVGIGRTPGEVELAERIVRHVPSAEQVLLASAGGDATYSAIRLARAVTGREYIVKFGGGFHGPHDYVLRSASSVNRHDGVLPAAAERLITCRYNDVGEVTDLFASRGEQIAAIIVEPIAFNANLLPEPEFLPALRRLATDHGALLIFDEVISGFRVGLGGAQALYGVTPDLTTLGKALGNGFPVAAIAGPAELMSRFATVPGGTVPYSGTHNGNAIAVAAANATLTVLENEPVYEHLSTLGDRMRTGLQNVANACGVPAVTTGYGSIYNLLFMDSLPRTYEDLDKINEPLFIAYRMEMLKRGVLEMPLRFIRAQVTYSHTTNDIDRALEMAEAALKAILVRHVHSAGVNP